MHGLVDKPFPSWIIVLWVMESLIVGLIRWTTEFCFFFCLSKVIFTNLWRIFLKLYTDELKLNFKNVPIHVYGSFNFVKLKEKRDAKKKKNIYPR